MHKFTDDFFGFPIKVYDGFSAKKAMEAQDKDTTDEPVPIDLIAGWAKIPAKDLPKMMWHDGFSRERKVEEVAKNGFDLTMVFSDIYGDFVCTWTRKKFEEKLNEFMEKRPTFMQGFNPYVPIMPIDTLASLNSSSPQGNETATGL